jgi:thiamine-monophosphate kinase
VDQKYIDELYAGMNRLAASAGASVVGGNISASPKDLVINVVLLGMVEEGKALLRSGARPGDLLFVTGELGLSAAGVELLKGGRLETEERGPCDAAGSAPLKAALDKHHTPTPRVREGRLLVELGCATAAIDLSDGLASDLRHICKESEVGAIIYSEKLPVASGVFALNDALTAPPIDYALLGGEDYELLVTIQRDKAKELKSNWGGGLAPITEVGIITERDKGIKLLDERGKSAELPSGGWDHLEAARDLD